MSAFTSEEMKKYRRNNPEYVARELLREKAKRKALSRLRGIYYIEYLKLLEEEYARVGFEESNF